MSFSAKLRGVNRFAEVCRQSRTVLQAKTVGIACFALTLCGLRVSGSSSELTLEIKDYAAMPITGSLEPTNDGNASLLARGNFLRQELGGKRRLFVNDMNGPLYIFDNKTKKFITYLNFNGGASQPGLFHKFALANGAGNGFISFQFDPDYVHNGKFYTIHFEDPAIPGSALPDNTHFPRLKTSGYSLTPAIPTPGLITREAVLIEWTDTQVSDSTFEGTAREIMRVQYYSGRHPMGDIVFNPTARPGDPDWRVAYIASGDGASGESKDTKMRLNPQRLDTLVGKILRIIPDTKEHTGSSTLSDNGQYRIPNDNPLVSKAGARKEIWAYGLRNPHRLSWDIDPADRANNHLIANHIGLNTWETVIIIRKGANYGFSLREGNQQLNPDNTTSSLPAVDEIPVQLNESKTDGMTVPTYPVIQYGHVKEGGDAISSGFVYRGRAIPLLKGKYLFGDITTGRIWYADYKQMLAAEDGDPKTLAQIHDVKILWNRPGGGKEVYSTMYPIDEATYRARGGKGGKLPGVARVAGGRADIRLAVDADGELYILSKSDGMIRSIVGAAITN